MSSSSLTLKTDRLGIAAALVAMLLLALLNFSSSGIVRGGDDDGSGIGGTGRLAAPGGDSGLGGTGFKPFLGMNDNNQLEIMRDPTQREAALTQSLDLAIAPSIPVEISVVASLVTVTSDSALTRDSSAISITEAIQHSIDINALSWQRLSRQIAAGEGVAASSFGRIATLPKAGPGAASVPDNRLIPAHRADAVSADTIDLAVLEQAPQEPITWSAVIRYLSHQLDSGTPEAGREMATNRAPGDAARLTRPERIRRPELPPLQRIRPIQRAAILPPRVKPLGL